MRFSEIRYLSPASLSSSPPLSENPIIPLTQNPVGAKHSPSNLSNLRQSQIGNASPKTFANHRQIQNRRDDLSVTSKRVYHLRMEILVII
jgi:hypothetical protein